MEVKLVYCNNKKTMLVWLTKSDSQDNSIYRELEEIKKECNICIFHSGSFYSCEENIKGLISNHIIN